MQVRGVIPVVEMPAKPRHPVHGAQGLFQPLHRLGLGQPAHVAGGDGGQQIQADVGGRRAVRHDRARGFLKVVGGQEIVALGHESLKKPPGPAGDLAQGLHIGRGKIGQGCGRLRQADPMGDKRGQHPKQRERQRQRPEQRVDEQHDCKGPDPQTDAADHATIRPGHPRSPRRPGLRRRHPFQQMPVRDEQADQRAQHRIQHRPGLVGQKDDVQADLRQRCPGILRQGHEMRPQAKPGSLGQDRMGQPEQARQGDHGQHCRSPDQGAVPRQQPSQQKCCKDEGADQRPAEIVQHLPAANHGNACPGQPRQQLPVAPHPPVLTFGRNVIAGREILDHLDIGSQRRAGENALEQIVAEHGVVGNTACHSGGKGIDIIDALAGKRPFAEQVLIDIGHGRGIGFDPARAGIHPLIDRPLGPDRQSWRDPGLQDAIPFGDALRVRVKPGPVHRMGHLADQGADGIAGQPRVGIQRDDIADILRQRRAGNETGVGGAAQGHVQFVQFATLAFPPHPAAFGWIPQPAAVQKMKPVCTLDGVAAVEFGHRPGGRLDQRAIKVCRFDRSIRSVRQKGIVDCTTNAGQIMHLKPFDLIQKIMFSGQQDGHGHQRPQIVGNAPRQQHPRQWMRGDRSGDDMIDQRNRQISRWPQRGQCQCQQRPAT